MSLISKETYMCNNAEQVAGRRVLWILRIRCLLNIYFFSDAISITKRYLTSPFNMRS